ncbi:MAG: AAA family ATPase, partial [Candidatus Thorarchaeota archaeon]
MHDPELYIFDEPSSGLDPLMQQELYKVIEEEVQKGKTFFISTHNLEEAQRLADVISIIRNGKIVETISVKELRKKVVQKVFVEFQDTEEINLINLNFPGVEETKRNGQRMILLVTDSLPQVLTTLGQHKLQSLTIPEPMLEDYFLHFYEKEV